MPKLSRIFCLYIFKPNHCTYLRVTNIKFIVVVFSTSQFILNKKKICVIRKVIPVS